MTISSACDEKHLLAGRLGAAGLSAQCTPVLLCISCCCFGFSGGCTFELVEWFAAPVPANVCLLSYRAIYRLIFLPPAPFLSHNHSHSWLSFFSSGFTNFNSLIHFSCTKSIHKKVPKILPCKQSHGILSCVPHPAEYDGTAPMPEVACTCLWYCRPGNSPCYKQRRNCPGLNTTYQNCGIISLPLLLFSTSPPCCCNHLFCYSKASISPRNDFHSLLI